MHPPDVNLVTSHDKEDVEEIGVNKKSSGEDSFECNDESLVPEVQQQQKDRLSRSLTRIIVGTMFLVSIVLITVGISLSSKKGISAIRPATSTGDEELSYTNEPSVNPSLPPSLSPSSNADVILGTFLARELGGNAPCFDVGTYQWQAKQWMTREDPLMLDVTDEKQSLKIIQRYALATIFYAMGGFDGSMKIDWMNFDECNSCHIECNEEGIVRELELDSVVVKGVIPAELTLLTKLEHLIIKNNKFLGGGIPKSIENLRELRQLDLNNNSLVGKVPLGIYTLGKLTYLNLSNNLLTGRLSEEIAMLVNLETLVLDNNNFTGDILPLHLRKTKLSFLSISGNKIDSSLMSEWRLLHHLEYLYLDRNEIKGSIPAEVGLITKLRSLSLRGNRLDGRIPTEIGSLTNLEYLSLAENNLTGSIPKAIGSCTMLSRFHLDNNVLTGVLPTSMETLKRLECLSMASNRLNGRVSDALEKLDPNLMQLSLSNNHFTGELGDSFCRLTNLEDLFLDTNKIHGALHDCIGDLTNMKRLLLFDNNISGSIPLSIGEMRSLAQLGLEENNLSGVMHAGICSIPTLVELWSDCAGTPPKVTCDKNCCTQCCPSKVCS